MEAVRVGIGDAEVHVVRAGSTIGRSRPIVAVRVNIAHRCGASVAVARSRQK